MTLLDACKAAINIQTDDTSFDDTLNMYIDGALATVRQLGVDLSKGVENLPPNIKAMVTHYTVLSVRIEFDPPSTGFQLEPLRKHREEIAWRLSMEASPHSPTQG